MLSYHNDPQLKALLVEEIEAHRLADQIVQGTHGEDDGKQWRGCAVGCAIHSLNRRLHTSFDVSDHAALADTAGWPIWLTHLADTIFEGLPPAEARLWPGQLVTAIPVGADIEAEALKHRFLIFVLRENLDRVRALAIGEDLKQLVSAAIGGALTLHERRVANGKWDESAARSAARSAWSAAWSAARSAGRSADSAALSAAWSANSAAWSADSAALSAARSAARSADSAAWSADSAAWSAAYRRYAAELLRLLSEAGPS